jgi:Amt family ammonium transporter
MRQATGAFTYGLLGLKGWFLTSAIGDTGVMVLFFFMMVFMDTTATIPTSAMAERWAWKNFCLFGLWVALPYCLYANWVWGGGWLAQVVLGTFILAFGWFGFNPGSTLAGTDLRISFIVVNTMLAGMSRRWPPW